MANGISITEARNSMGQLPRKLAKRRRALAVTKRGKPVLAILPWEYYEFMEETLAILADRNLMRQIRRSEKELAEGKGIPWPEAKKNLGW